MGSNIVVVMYLTETEVTFLVNFIHIFYISCQNDVPLDLITSPEAPLTLSLFIYLIIKTNPEEY